VTAATAPAGEAGGRTSAYRPDIEGMRALAVLLVMLYHAGLPPRAGFLGVDVFFVISGFLISGILIEELERTGRISWPRFLARRARRLLPAAVLVLVVTAAVSWFVVPGLRRHAVGLDISWAAVYLVNWRLAEQSVNYLTSDSVPSPVQHFWTLAVEEQFYVVWPVLLIGAAALLRLTGRRLHRAHLALLVALIGMPSLAWSVWLTQDNPERAYFVTTTRLWELAVGAAVAVALAGRHAGVPSRTGRGVAGGLAALGLGLVVGCAVLLPETAWWPGAWALLPTVGTALLIVAGWIAPSHTIGRILGWRPLVVIGGLSYSLYLWHWPVRVLGEWVAGVPGATSAAATPTRVALVAVSVVPAWLGYRLVEQPIHRGTGWPALGRFQAVRPALAMALVLSLSGVVAGLVLLQARSSFATSAAAAAPGQLWATPDPLDPGADRPRADVDRCQVRREVSEAVRCDFGMRDGATTVALVGDSKAMQWLPALELAALREGWHIVTYGKGSCTFVGVPTAEGGKPFPECDEWNARVVDELRTLAPDVIVTSSSPSLYLDDESTPEEHEAAVVPALTEQWRTVQRIAPLVVIGNSPTSPNDLDVCAARNPDNLAVCDFDKEEATADNRAAEMRRAAAAVPGVRFVDLTDLVCPGESCPLVIEHVTVHRAGNHITATFAERAEPILTPVVHAAASAGRQ
jgi:peptidoglycan/LPS O-acetylase OafA/YrhL